MYKSIECPEGHCYENSVDGYSIFYGRDRNEKDVSARTYDSIEGVFPCETQEYNYFWDGEKWLIREDDNKFQTLTNEIIKKD